MAETRATEHGSALPAAAQVGGSVVAQFGSAAGDLGFAIAGPAPVVAIRQTVAAVTFLLVARPPIHRMRWTQLWPALALGISVVVMNMAFYFAIDRLPLGLAVTLEFTGPLAVVLFSTRRWIDVAIAAVAFGGVMLLTGTVHDIDWLGVLFVFIAAAGWAGYIVLSKLVGQRLPGLQGSAVSMTTAAICTLPIMIVTLARLPEPQALRLLGWGALCALLATIIPQAIDMTVLRRMPRALFGVLQSASPAFAAIVGLIVLHQTLSLLQVAGLAVICAANVAAVLSGRRRPSLAGEVAVVPTTTGAITVVEAGPEFIDLPEGVIDEPVVPDHVGGDTQPITL